MQLRAPLNRYGGRPVLWPEECAVPKSGARLSQGLVMGYGAAQRQCTRVLYSLVICWDFVGSLPSITLHGKLIVASAMIATPICESIDSNIVIIFLNFFLLYVHYWGWCPVNQSFTVGYVFLRLPV